MEVKLIVRKTRNKKHDLFQGNISLPSDGVLRSFEIPAEEGNAKKCLSIGARSDRPGHFFFYWLGTRREDPCIHFDFPDLRGKEYVFLPRGIDAECKFIKEKFGIVLKATAALIKEA